jgi:hypothetical protein
MIGLRPLPDLVTSRSSRHGRGPIQEAIYRPISDLYSADKNLRARP